MESPETAAHGGATTSPLLGYPGQHRRRSFRSIRTLSLVMGTSLVILLVVLRDGRGKKGSELGILGLGDEDESVKAEQGVVATDDERCSQIGVAALRAGGNAVDAAVAAAFCLGVVNPMSSGIGGGAFILVRISAAGKTEAFDCRETAPLASSQNMYDSNPTSKSEGALSMGVPGEIAGLYEAWSRHGKLPWKSLVEPAISLARDGFIISPYLASGIQKKKQLILSDPGLRSIFFLNDTLLHSGDKTRNPSLSQTLAAISVDGAAAFYGGPAGEALARDVFSVGGLLTIDDLRNYKVKVSDAIAADVFGYTVLGMPPPSSGTVGLSMVLKILAGYGDQEGDDILHRFIEALKHMFAKRMDLGDPEFVDVSGVVADMLSSNFAEKIRRRINDNETFSPEYYLPRWSQLEDRGTSHLCVVDAERNAVSMTSTVNYFFGAGVMSPSTGIVLNNEMNDFSAPAELAPDKLPPAPSNFIQPAKRPLSSMTPIIVLKEDRLAGILGASGGLNIISAVSQVFLNHFVLGMSAVDAVKHPRLYHTLIPNVLRYENLTTYGGSHIQLSTEAKTFLGQRGHALSPIEVASVCQLVVQDLQKPVYRRGDIRNRKLGDGQIFRGLLTAVSDPRKGGRPAGI